MKRFPTRSWLLAVGASVGLFALGSSAGRAQDGQGAAVETPVAAARDTSAPYDPPVAAASDEGQRAIQQFRKPEGLEVDLFAAEPLLANPVAFWIDNQGRAYVAETFRHHAGVTDNRSHMSWLDDDLAARTVADRVAMYRKHLGDEFATYGQEHDRVRLLRDTDGDGRADTATVFADGFNNPADGIGAGVLEHNGKVYYTCIPDLWMLADPDGDGQAEERRSLHHGYGVHVAFLGHDLHGLRIGPDGKLYFSIGDRGLNIETEGRKLACPDSGAVLRCNLDGSDLELFATGLRNPQELAFDDFGNLFTGDNNSDGGDKARWVNVVEGSDTGWRMYYQYLRDRGPWNNEKLWHPQHAGQPAYLVPPIANLGDGPSGLAYYPGTGLPERYDNHFFMADFRGSISGSGVRAFTVRPKGAFFELDKSEQFLWSIVATDCDFGPDGKLYVSDWIEGWEKPRKGRLYRVFDPGRVDSAIVREVQQLLASGLAEQPTADLIKLLAHRDQRVRQMAQFRLADQGAAVIAPLTQVAQRDPNLLARVHAIWGLGQIGRQDASAHAAVLPLLHDPNGEVRAQAARVLGDGRVTTAGDGLIRLLADADPRARMYAALGLGKLERPDAVPALLKLLAENNDDDPVLRHAGVMGLAGCGAAESLAAAITPDSSQAEQMGVLLALRRRTSPKVAMFLAAAEPALVAEAARAIYDTPIEAALPALAALVGREEIDEPTFRRALAANHRLRGGSQAAAVAAMALDSAAPESRRVAALEALADWAAPAGRDRVLGRWWPLEPVSAEIAALPLRGQEGRLLSGPAAVQRAAVKAAVALGLSDAGPSLADIVQDKGHSSALRGAALDGLAKLRHPLAAEAVRTSLDDSSPRVRLIARALLAETNPELAVVELAKSLHEGTTAERQAALATLAKIDLPAADTVLESWLAKLLAGEVPAEIELDLLTAAAGRESPEIIKQLAQFEAARPEGNVLAKYRESLQGGDAERGEEIFFTRADVSCQRCHKVGDRGGEVGPDLSRIGAQQTREYLLAAVVDPNRDVAKGFETVVVALADGRVVAGVLKRETDAELELVTPELLTVRVLKDEIDERTTGKSGMPEQTVSFLSKADVRDLVEFLAGQR